MLNLIAATLLAFICGASAAIATFSTDGAPRTSSPSRNVWIAVAVAAAIGAVLLASTAHNGLAGTP